MIDKVLWPDAELDSIVLDYDAVAIQLTESTGRKVLIQCIGHIGLSFAGFWDEVIVEKAELRARDPIIDLWLSSMKNRHNGAVPESGSTARNRGAWTLLRITLIDGLTIDIVASAFSAQDA